MRRILAIAALAIPMMASSIVTYNTTGTVFMPGSVTTIPAPGGGLSYLSGGGSVDLSVINPSNATFGTLNTVGFPTPVSLAGWSLVLHINQSTPTVGSGTVTGSLAGTVVVNASNAYVHFATPTLTLGPVTYEIFQPNLGGGKTGIAIVPPSTDQNGTIVGGTTTIQGFISATQLPFDTGTPEPATVGLMGVGLVAVGLIRRYSSR